VTQDRSLPNGIDTDQATVYVFDTYGNAVTAGLPVTSTARGTQLQVVTPSATTGVNGQAVLSYTSLLPGVYQADVIVGGVTPSGSPVSLVFRVDPQAPDQLELLVAPAGPVTAGGVYTLTVSNQTGGSPVDNIPVSFTGPPELIFVGGVSSCVTGQAGQPGRCSVQVTGLTAGSYPVQATVPDPTAGGAPAPVQGSPAQLVFTAGTICVTNCTPVDPTHVTRVEVIRNGAAFDGVDQDLARVFAYDQFGNPVSGALVGSSTADPALTVQPVIAATASDGTSTVWYTSTVAGNHLASVQVAGLTPVGSPVTLGFGSNVGDPGNSQVTITPVGPLTVGTGPASSYTAQAVVRDVFNQPVSGAVVSFTVSPLVANGPVFGAGGSSCVTNQAGSCQVVLSSTKSGTYSIQGSLVAGPIGTALSRAWAADEVCAALSGCTPDNPNLPPVYRTRVEVTTDHQLANGSTPDVATVYAFDKWGNPVPGALVLSTTADADLRIDPGIPGTNDQGVSRIQYRSTVAGPHVAAVSVAGKIPTGSPITVNFIPQGPCVAPCVPDPGVPNDKRSRVEVDPDGQTADGQAQDVANVYLFDAQGNPTPGQVVTGALPAGSPLTVQSAPVAPTDAQGRTTISYTSKTAGSHEAQAFVAINGVATEIKFTPQPGVTPDPVIQSSPFQVRFVADTPCVAPCVPDPGVPNDKRSRVEVDPDGQTADGVAQDVANVYLFDQFGNPVSNVAVTGALPAGSVLTAQSAPVAPTDAQGRTTIGYTSKTAGGHLAQAFYTLPGGSPVEIVFTPQPGSTPDPVIQSSPFQVTFVADGPCVAPCVPDPSVPNEKRSRIVVDPDGQTADGVAEDVAQVFLFDQNGNPVSNVAVTQSKTDQSLLVQSASIQPTDAAGRTTIGYRSLVAGPHHARAFYSVAGVNTEIVFTPQPGVTPDPVIQSSPFTVRFTADTPCVEPGCTPDPSVPNDKRSRIEVDPDSQTADGQAQDVVNVYVFDQHGNPVSGVQVSESTTGSPLVVQSTPIQPTDAQGKTVIGYTSRVAGEHTGRVFIRVNGVDQEIKFTPQPGSTPDPVIQSSPFKARFVADGPCVAPCVPDPSVPNDKRSRIVVDPDNQNSDGQAEDVAQVFLFDQFGNPVPGYQVTTQSLSAALVVKTTSVPLTGADGKTSVAYSSAVGGQHQARVFYQPAAGGTPVEVVFTPQPGVTPPAWFQSSPVTLTFADVTAPVMIYPADGAFINTGRPTVTGTADIPGAVLKVKAGSTVICVTTVLPDQTWSCPVPAGSELADGRYVLTAVKADQAGNESVASTPHQVTVDTVKPVPPHVIEPGDGSSINDSKPTVSGDNGEPGNTIVVDAGGGNQCTAQVQPDGTWSCQLPQELPEAPADIKVTETDPAGNTSDETTVHVDVDLTAPDQPVITRPRDGSAVNDPRPEAAGTAEPGSTVVVDAGNDNRCTATVAADGTWSCRLPKPLPDGPNKIVVTATDEAGNTSDPVDSTFTVDTVAPKPPTVEGNEDNLHGTGEPGDQITVTGPDGKPVCDTTVNPSGNWECKPQAQTPLQPGDKITVTETDQAGNSVNVDYVIPRPLPSTGSQTGATLAGSALLAALLGGICLLVAARRRRRENPAN
jgi:LPXTG-motif cell wall-anchored protein